MGDLDRRLGFTGRAFLNVHLLPFAALVAEAGYAQRGYSEQFEVRDAMNNPGPTLKRNMHYDYLVTALLAKVSLPGPAVTPYVLVGPRFSLLLGDHPGTFHVEVNDTVLEVTDGLPGYYERQSWGSTLGLGVEAARLLPLPVFLEVRYEFDVTDATPAIPRDMHHNAINVLLGLTLW